MNVEIKNKTITPAFVPQQLVIDIDTLEEKVNLQWLFDWLSMQSVDYWRNISNSVSESCALIINIKNKLHE